MKTQRNPIILAALILGAITAPSVVFAVTNTARDGSAAQAPACTDARLVTVTKTKPAWHNGRGPLTTVALGQKLECTSCDKPMVAMKPSGHNARGAMAPVEIRGKHDCTKGGCGTAVASKN
ncbi:hypothetical protein [Opitutus terrae]|uniref:Uncharacterized protein n=1 Tax=Opitutus terrae (strain DSM 11246 / JCM 15787 / PB90-1) TaxID=452637 RepID=B1ZPY9_OPITP|nr:hypothetical protein [Opitutus terrae]ACB77710.1 hypothetical protein Oter_4439 [Opitutus terrae PB90-1]